MKETETQWQELAMQAKTGDREAFSALMRHFMKPVVALTYRMTGDRDSAADLAQESFIAAWQSLTTFRGEAKFESWLYRIATNKTLNYLKSRREVALPDYDIPELETSPMDAPDALMVREDLRRGVIGFMSTLPAQQRLAFNLRFYKQMSFPEIAEMTGGALGTVKTNYREAVKKLRDYAIEKGWK